MGTLETENPSPLRWVMLACGTLAFLFTFITRFSWPPLIPVVMPIMHFSGVQAGAFMTAFYFGYVITQIPAGVLCDRLGPRWVLTIGLLLEGFMIYFMKDMQTFNQGFWLRFFMGLGAGADMSAASRALTEWFPARERAVAWGILMASPSLGLMMPNWIVPALNTLVGWRGAFQWLGYATIIAAIIVCLFMRSSPSAVRSKLHPLHGLKVVFTSRNLLLLGLTGFSLMWAEIGLATWANAYFTKIGFSLGTAGIIMVIYGVGAILSPLTSPLWIRMFGKMKSLMFWMFIIQIPFTFLFAYLHNYVALLIVGFLFGYFSYMVNAPLNVMITDEAGKEWASTAVGTTNFIFQWASLIVPMVIGAVVDATGSIHDMWFIVVAGSIVGAVCIGLVNVKEISTK